MRSATIPTRFSQNTNKGQLTTLVGLIEFNPPPADKCLKNIKKGIRRYRRYVYKAGAIDRPDKMQARVIDNEVVAKDSF